MKLFKRVIAAGAALMMAVTGMTVSASADTWSVYFIPSSPYGIKYLDIKTFTYSVVPTRFYDGCSTYSQSTNSQGLNATVDYWAYFEDSSGDINYGTDLTRKYISTESTHQVPLQGSATSSYHLVVKHRIAMNGNSCTMSGEVHI